MKFKVFSMMPNKIFLVLIKMALLLLTSPSWAVNKGISFQTFIKSPNGTTVNATGLTVNAKVLAPNGCILREENFSNVDVVNGYMNIIVTKGTVGGADRGFSVQKIFDNTPLVITGLTCVNADGSVNGAVTSYTPSSSDIRKLRISTLLGSDTIIADFNLRSVPFASNAETVNGKVDTDFVNINNSQKLSQANVESIFNRFTKLDAILNSFNAGGTAAGINVTGNAANVTGTVAIANGGTGATTLAGAKTALGIGTVAALDLPTPLDATKVLKGDGTWGTITGGVSSVAGKTGAVTLTNSDVSGLGPLATMSTSGTPDGSKFLRDDGAWTAISATDTTKLPLSGGTITGALNMSSQDITAVNNVNATNVNAGAGAFTNLKVYDGSANYLTQNYPTGGTSYTIKWPASVGSANQVLQINSISGNVATLGWATGASSGVSSVTAAGTAGNPLSVGGTASAPTIDISAATSSANGYLKSADWATFNSKQAGSTELSGLVTGMVSTGIVQRTAAGTYTTLGTSSPLSVVAGDITLGTVPVGTGGTGSTDGSISGTGALTFAAGGTNQNVTLTPSGTGSTILNGNIGIRTSSPVQALSVGNSIQATSDYSTAYVPRQVQINDLYTNTASGQHSTMSIFAQAGASANSTSVDTAFQVDNFVPSSQTVNYAQKIGIRAQVNNAGSGNAGNATGGQFLANYSGTGTPGAITGSTSTASNLSAVTMSTVYGSQSSALNSSTGSITNAYGALNSVLNSTGTVTAAYGIYGNVGNLSTGTVGTAYGLYSNITNGASATMTSAYGLYLTKSVNGVASSNNFGIYQADSSNNYFAGNLGMGLTNPSAALHLRSGTSMAGTAPLKLTAGINLMTPEAGAIEYDGTSLYYTDETATRRTIASTATGSGAFSGVSSLTNASGDITLAPATLSGAVLVNSGAASTGTSSGAVVVTGGMGLSGDIFSGASINATTAMTAGSSLTTPQIYGSSAASGNVKIDGTSNATKGHVLLASAGGNVGIGTTGPLTKLNVQVANAPNTDDGITVGRAMNASLIGLKLKSDGSGNYRGAITSKGNGFSETEVMTFLADGTGSGNVGIGTTSPLTVLHLQKQGAGGEQQVYLDSYSGSSSGAPSPNFVGRSSRGTPEAPLAVGTNDVLSYLTGRGYNSSSSNFAGAAGFLNGAYIAMMAAENWTGAGNGSYMTFNTSPIGTASNGYERMRIDPSGNVGIGTTTPSTTLDLATGSFSAGGFSTKRLFSGTWDTTKKLQIASSFLSSGNSTFKLAFKSTAACGATYFEEWTVQSGAYNQSWGNSLIIRNRQIGGGNCGYFINPSIAFEGSWPYALSISNTNPIPNLEIYFQGYGAGDVSTSLVAGTVTGQNNQLITENFINNYVGIGTTNPTQRLQVGSSGDGSVAIANAWNTFSDIRLKRDIERIPNACAMVDKLSGYYYHWRTGEDHSRQVGVIAQEVEAVLPELVKTGRDGIKTVDYPKLTAVLIEASKQHNRDIATLKAKAAQFEVENAKLKQENADVKARLERIEKILGNHPGSITKK
ncbi:tail fiber domain-containing protein [Bdellovibrio sp.]|uniref:tail fiber domain-containing protein n=1 Tax=Bdellovibrio sp. TaxID=28201 RepID=UPI0039E25E18